MKGRPGGTALAPPGSATRLRGYLLAAFAAACWASGGLLAKWLFSRSSLPVEPAVLSAARAMVSFALLLAWTSLRRRDALRVSARDLPFLGAFGVVGLALVHVTYFQTISLTNVATAILLEYLAPVIVLAVSVVFLGERFSWLLPAAVALSVGGCALMVGAVGGRLVVSPAGIRWGLASAACFALYTLMGKYAAPRYGPFTLLTYGLGAASAFWLAVLGPGPVVRLLAEPMGAVSVVAMSVVSTIAPFGAFLLALRYVDATKASVTATLEPVLAGLAAYALFGETLTGLQLLGGALVFAAILTVQGPGLLRTALPPHD